MDDAILRGYRDRAKYRGVLGIAGQETKQRRDEVDKLFCLKRNDVSDLRQQAALEATARCVTS